MRDMASLAGRRAVEDERCGEIRAIGGEAESLSAAPAETRATEYVCCSRTEVFCRSRRRAFRSAVTCSGLSLLTASVNSAGGERVGAAAVRSHAGEQIGSNGDVACFGDFVGEFLRPIAKGRKVRE